MRFTVLVLDPDVTYQARFMARVEKSPDDPLDWEWARDVEAALARMTPPDLLLVSEELDQDAVIRAYSQCEQTPLMMMWRKTAPAYDAVGLCKYQSVEAIRHYVLYVLSLQKPRIPQNSRGGKLLAFSSVDGGVGTSTLARAAARAYIARQDRALFYWSMDPLGRGRLSVETSSPFTLSDLVLSMRLNSGDPVLRLDACRIHQGKLSTILPPKRASDAMEITTQEWVRFFELLKDSEEKILIDLPIGYFYTMPDLVRQLDGLVLILRRAERGLVEHWSQLAHYPWKAGRDHIIVREGKAPAEGVCVPYLEDANQTRTSFEKALQNHTAMEEVIRWMSETAQIPS